MNNWATRGDLALGRDEGLLAFDSRWWRTARWEVYRLNRKWYLAVVAQPEFSMPRDVISRVECRSFDEAWRIMRYWQRLIGYQNPVRLPAWPPGVMNQIEH